MTSINIDVDLSGGGGTDLIPSSVIFLVQFESIVRKAGHAGPRDSSEEEEVESTVEKNRRRKKARAQVVHAGMQRKDPRTRRFERSLLINATASPKIHTCSFVSSGFKKENAPVRARSQKSKKKDPRAD